MCHNYSLCFLWEGVLLFRSCHFKIKRFLFQNCLPCWALDRQNTSWVASSLAVVSSIAIKLKICSQKILYYTSSLLQYCPRFFNREAHVPSEKNLGTILCEWNQSVFHLKTTIKKFDLTVEFQVLSICLLKWWMYAVFCNVPSRLVDHQRSLNYMVRIHLYSQRN